MPFNLLSQKHRCQDIRATLFYGFPIPASVRPKFIRLVLGAAGHPLERFFGNAGIQELSQCDLRQINKMIIDAILRNARKFQEGTAELGAVFTQGWSRAYECL